MIKAEVKNQEPTVSENTSPTKPAAAHKKTAGEKIFDRTVYTGIGFGVNEASTLWITDQFMHGSNLLKSLPGPFKKIGSWFSQEGFEAASAWVGKTFKFTDKIAKDGATITSKARGGNALLMVTLLSGGTLLLLPMRWLENSKSYWVKKANHWADKLRGNKLSPEKVAARDEEVEAHIASSPKQSWGSLLLGRVIACSASVGTGTFLVGPQNNQKIMDASEKFLARSIQPKEQKNRWHRYAALIGVETYSCAISSIVLEIASKFFAKRKPAAKNPASTPADPSDAPTTESSDTNIATATLKKSAHALMADSPRLSHAQKVSVQTPQLLQPSL